MINWVWLFFIVCSVIVALLGGNSDEIYARMEGIFNSIPSSCTQAVTISIGLIGIMAFWMGIMKIAEKSGLMALIARALSPVIRLLFPDIPKKHPVQGDITMNVAANALGLGNAATPFGIKAMEGLQEINKNKDKSVASDSMCIFLTMNTAGVQLIPISVMAILISLEGTNVTDIILPTLITTLTALVLGLIFVRILIKLSPEPSKKKGNK